ncbi:putative sulfate exporter family transporter [Amphritea sp. 1_MG-2023]|uniref:YeiH family protein n=1 Tax=Amphritea sp. 1_MG-2023 TaxID=3062670 RepID=UPI0026E25FD5|nr:putative sulfate exporter family transporter [Amphritea sp. 1_MG-2023]MDO6565173.1 putative sulfate exporter family transporter [Amphritea sp. 1_MG-2023]
MNLLKLRKAQGLECQKAVQAFLPGLTLCLVVGMAASFVSEHYGGPVILYALLMGMAFNYLSEDDRYSCGIQFSAKSVLRFGIALLGARITVEQLMSLGITPIVIVLVAVPATIGFGFFLGRRMKLGRCQSLLTGSSVGICGASAALAVAAVLPQDKDAEKNLIFTVICVTALSTVAMIAYPLIVTAFDLDEVASGVFLGATIHDVAQVVGAGYMMSDEIGDVATFTKLLRVSMLVPAVLIISLIVSRWGATEVGSKPKGFPLPGFLVAFIIIVTLNSGGFIVPELSSFMVETSRWCLVVAMVALGMKSSFKELAAMGWRPMILMVAETVFLAVLVLIFLQF